MSSLHDPQRLQTTCPCHIVIIGGGLAGVASALALKQAGHDVTILERAPELRQVGAGIQLSPNATRVLSALGVLPAVLPHALQPHAGGLRAWRTGAVLGPSNARRATDALATYGHPYLLLHRADLLRALIAAAAQWGIVVRLGAAVTRLAFAGAAGAPAVHLASGERVQPDVLLGADGERSLCREALLGRADPPVPTGDVVFRITMPRADVVASSAAIAQPGCTNLWLGPDAHAVSYMLNSRSSSSSSSTDDEVGILNVVLVRKSDSPGEEEEGVYGAQRASLAELREAFRGWDPALQGLLEVPGQTECAKWQLLRTEEVARWRGREGEGEAFALIGDAAHGMPPFLAQGAAMAFEDAAVLGAVFARVKDKAEVAAALRVFEEVRKPRAAEVRRRTLARKKWYELHDGPEQRARDARLALGPMVGAQDELADPEFQRWLWGYDAAADGARAWEERLVEEAPGEWSNG